MHMVCDRGVRVSAGLSGLYGFYVSCAITPVVELRRNLQRAERQVCFDFIRWMCSFVGACGVVCLWYGSVFVLLCLNNGSHERSVSQMVRRLILSYKRPHFRID